MSSFSSSVVARMLAATAFTKSLFCGRGSKHREAPRGTELFLSERSPELVTRLEGEACARLVQLAAQRLAHARAHLLRRQVLPDQVGENLVRTGY